MHLQDRHLEVELPRIDACLDNAPFGRRADEKNPFHPKLVQQQHEGRAVERRIPRLEDEEVVAMRRERSKDAAGSFLGERLAYEPRRIRVPAASLIVDVDDRNLSFASGGDRIDHRSNALLERGQQRLAVVVVEVVEDVYDKECVFHRTARAADARPARARRSRPALRSCRSPLARPCRGVVPSPLPRPCRGAEREDRSLEHVLELRRVRCVDRERGEERARSRRPVLPGFVRRQLVDAGDEEPQAGRCEHERRDELRGEAADAGAHIATPATRRNSPSASLVEPGRR